MVKANVVNNGYVFTIYVINLRSKGVVFSSLPRNKKVDYIECTSNIEWNDVPWCLKKRIFKKIPETKVYKQDELNNSEDKKVYTILFTFVCGKKNYYVCFFNYHNGYYAQKCEILLENDLWTSIWI